MSIVEQGATQRNGRLIAWIAYGLSVVSFALPLFARGPHLAEMALAALALPPVIFALMLTAPESFIAHERYTHKLTLNALPIIGLVGFWSVGLRNVLDWRLALAPAALCAAISLLLGVGLVGKRWPGSIIWASVVMAAFGAGYGFGGMVFANRVFDGSPGETYTAVVQREYVSHGRSTSHHVVLGPWGDQAGETDVSVYADVYNALQPGQTACVRLHPGYLHLRWFSAGVCDGA